MKAVKYDRDEIAGCMKTLWAGRNVLFFDELDSTNLQAAREAGQGAAHGTLVVADRQTAGRGRRGRVWNSPAGANIYFTLLLRPEIEPDRTSMLTLVMALAVAKGIRRTIEELSPGGKANLPDIGIKWPNDIVIEGKKVCGILTELLLKEGSVIIGVGVNVSRQEFGAELADRAVCLEEVCGVRPDRSALIANIMQAFETAYSRFMYGGSLASLREEYNSMLVNTGREVCVQDPGGEYRGLARGINDEGELLVELPDGRTERVFAGEVSVRGVCGYV